jgi:histone acetyltransferase 1
MNFQSILLLFIDGLSFIELDPYWTYYIIYKKTQLPSTRNYSYAVAGFATTYEFWDKNAGQCRTRISQFLILPPYQRQGFGTELLDVFFTNNYIGNIYGRTQES